MTAATAAKWIRRIQGIPVENWPDLREPTIDESEIVDPARELDVDRLELLHPRQLGGLLDGLDRVLEQARTGSTDA